MCRLYDDLSYLTNVERGFLRPWYKLTHFWSGLFQISYINNWCHDVRGGLANVYLDISRFYSYVTVDHFFKWLPYLMINFLIRFDERTFLFSASCPPVCWPRPSSKSSCLAAAVKRVTKWQARPRQLCQNTNDCNGEIGMWEIIVKPDAHNHWRKMYFNIPV